MTASPRSVLTAAGTALGPSRNARAAAVPAGDRREAAAALVQRSADAHGALMRGDVRTYRSLITFTDDFTLMSPFGGTTTHASSSTSGRMEAMGRFFRNGTFAQELVQAYASAEMVVLVIIERQTVEVGGLPAQDWPLRVTLVYRREDGDWRLAHRHADPLVNGITLEHAAALARGEAVSSSGRDRPVGLRR